MDAEYDSVEKDKVYAPRVQVVVAEQVDVFDAEVEAEPFDGRLVVVCCHVGRERQILDESTRLPLWGVRGAEHPPLGRL